ncbi:GIY-YIG nuclease family protein [Patescibacteria group bacterium]|nr:GIY-YIG nuclease family protein [Patescibacteria group bacterium]
MKKYYCYLARCSDDTIYTGYTTNLKDRELKHNSGQGAKYTKQRRPVKIIYWEEFASVGKAMKREAEIKTWSKTAKENLIKNSL